MTQASGSLYHRGGNADGWSGSWREILDSSNYTSYAPNKDGTGASGVWNIGITGNAATATKATQDGSGNTITSTYAYKYGIAANQGYPSNSGYGMVISAKPHKYGAATNNDNYYILMDSARKFWIGTQINAATTPTWTSVITSDNIGSQSVNYATSAGSCTGNAATATKLGTSTKGSSTKPIYLSSGTATECSTYAGGTAVTLNGSDKAGSIASFYAPVTAVAPGYVLQSNGGNAPYWNSNISFDSTYDKSIEFNGTTTVNGNYANSFGYNTTANSMNFVIGHYNKNPSTGSINSTAGDAFVIGNGTSSSRANAFRVNYTGQTYSSKTSIITGADYAEYFEWQDSNPNNEDRRGYFVTMDSNKIKIAEPNDYILGIVSAMPAVLGNGDEDWRGRYIHDEFGDYIPEEFEYEEEVKEEVVDEETGETTTVTKTVTKIGTKWKENPDYDPSIPYIQREDRPEWDAVGMVGVLAVRDDGTCQVNGYCKVAAGGTATAASERTLDTYRIIERVNDHIVKVILK